MPQSLANLVVHIVFSTKNRDPFLHDQVLPDEMHRELGGTSKTLSCPPILVGEVEDHVHILARQSRTITLADWIKELKRVTSGQPLPREPRRPGPSQTEVAAQTTGGLTFLDIHVLRIRTTPGRRASL